MWFRGGLHSAGKWLNLILQVFCNLFNSVILWSPISQETWQRKHLVFCLFHPHTCPPQAPWQSPQHISKVSATTFCKKWHFGCNRTDFFILFFFLNLSSHLSFPNEISWYIYTHCHSRSFSFAQQKFYFSHSLASYLKYTAIKALDCSHCKGNDVLLLENTKNKTPQDLKWLIHLKRWYYLQPRAALLANSNQQQRKKTMEQSLKHICPSNIEGNFTGTYST